VRVLQRGVAIVWNADGIASGMSISELQRECAESRKEKNILLQVRESVS
jgi:hypothetical protein